MATRLPAEVGMSWRSVGGRARAFAAQGPFPLPFPRVMPGALAALPGRRLIRVVGGDPRVTDACSPGPPGVTVE